MLNWYLQQVQRLVGYDEHQEIYNIFDLREFVNIARKETAAQGQCIRRLTQTSGSVLDITVTNSGSGYTNPTLVITAPDLPNAQAPYPTGRQATGLAQQVAGMIVTAGVVDGGSGYFNPPLVTIVDPTGVGATAVATVSPTNHTIVGQEVYNFSTIDLTPFPGVESILSVLGVSLVWGNWQWSASRCSMTKYMAQVRLYTNTFFSPPAWCAQYGQGTDGSLYMYPLADQPYPMSWDCLCLPIDLIDNTSEDAIPQPWTRAVPYYAAHLALLAKSAQIPQMLPLANQYFNEKTGGLFGTMMRRARAFSQPGYTSSYYGRAG